MSTLTGNEQLIAVSGATGQQGGGVARALQARGQFTVRALSRNPNKHRNLSVEVVKADLNRPETLEAAFEGATDQLFDVGSRECPGSANVNPLARVGCFRPRRP